MANARLVALLNKVKNGKEAVEEWRMGNEYEHEGINLTNISLDEGFDFRGADLCDAHFEGSNMPRANFEGADLRSVHMHNATIVDGNFYAARLRMADMTRAKLRGSNFSGADLEYAKLAESDLRKAVMHETKLSYTIIHRSLAQSVDFTGADMEGTDLRYTKLEGAVFRMAVLKWTKLSAADFAPEGIQKAAKIERVLTNRPTLAKIPGFLFDSRIGRIVERPPLPKGYRKKRL